MTPVELVMASAVVFLGASLQGSVGFGLGMLAAPLLVLIDPGLVPGPLLAVALVLTTLIARRERHAIDFQGIGWALLGRVPGTFVGAVTMLLAPVRGTALLVGFMVLVGVALVGSDVTLPRSRPVLVAAGILSGFMGTTTSIGGPPVAVIYHDAPGDRLRGTLSGFFIVGLVLSLLGLGFVGRFGMTEIASASWLLPGVVLGFVLSNRLAPVMDRGYTRKTVLTVSALAGALVIVQTLVTATGNGP
ncbi:MAG TPA: sulfite exporter TauE/SafE family protein [Vicinamibacteria bacterium]|nr:sulfite exporter TauE/SafE family protein [Vicinamibacteria bacterium]